MRIDQRFPKPIDAKSAHRDVLRVQVPARPRKRPRQARSILLVEALKQAARDILEKEGRAALSLLRLADRSGVAVSSIYEYFPTMDSLVAAIFHDYRLEFRQRICAEIAALPPSARLFDGILLMTRRGCSAMQKWLRIDPECNGELHYLELVRLDLIKSEQLQWSFMATSALMERFPEEITVRACDQALFLFHQTLQALPRAIVIEKPAYLGEPDVPLLLARMLHALLTTPGE
jgi:AcrR family transcriptional regulator